MKKVNVTSQTIRAMLICKLIFSRIMHLHKLHKSSAKVIRQLTHLVSVLISSYKIAEEIQAYRRIYFNHKQVLRQEQKCSKTCSWKCVLYYNIQVILARLCCQLCLMIRSVVILFGDPLLLVQHFQFLYLRIEISFCSDHEHTFCFCIAFVCIDTIMGKVTIYLAQLMAQKVEMLGCHLQRYESF